MTTRRRADIAERRLRVAFGADPGRAEVSVSAEHKDHLEVVLRRVVTPATDCG
jgi:hypothetical protein